MNRFLAGLIACVAVAACNARFWYISAFESPYRHLRDTEKMTILAIGSVILIAAVLAALFRSEEKTFSPLIVICFHLPLCLAVHWVVYRPVGEIAPLLWQGAQAGAIHLQMLMDRI